MRSIAEMSKETKALIDLFKHMAIDDVMTWDEAGKIVGFPVRSSLAAYTSARRIATRDHGLVIDGIFGIGFKKIDGEAIVSARGPKHLKSIKRRAQRGAMEMEAAIGQNLDDKTALDASEKLTRFRLLQDMSKSASSNRRRTAQPEAAEPVDIRSRLAARGR